MKISTKVKKCLDAQIVLESNASNTYLAIASWCEVTGYDGSAAFFYLHAQEERDHMLKIVHYLNDIGSAATIPGVQPPASDYKSLETVIKTALNNERLVTKAIHSIVETAQKEKDYTTFAFIEWFVTEQIEEEKQLETILQKFDLLGRDKLAIHEIDKLLSANASATTTAAASN